MLHVPGKTSIDFIGNRHECRRAGDRLSLFGLPVDQSPQSSHADGRVCACSPGKLCDRHAAGTQAAAGPREGGHRPRGRLYAQPRGSHFRAGRSADLRASSRHARLCSIARKTWKSNCGRVSITRLPRRPRHCTASAPPAATFGRSARQRSTCWACACSRFACCTVRCRCSAFASTILRSAPT